MTTMVEANPASRRWRRLAVALALVAGPGCMSSPRAGVTNGGAPGPLEPVAAAATGGAVASTAAIDFSQVVARVRAAFREDGGGWRTAGAGWSARVADGAFEVVARGEAGESSALRLGPVEVRRGGASLGRAVGPAERQPDGGLLVARGGAAERFVNRRVGVEVTWTFEAQPAGRGDLLVRLPARGLDFAGVGPGGARFADAQTGLSLRFGHGTWVDARGVKTPVPVAFEGGALRLRVPEAVLAASAWPAVLDPVVGPAFDIGERRWGPSPGSQADAAVASSASGFLAVWNDTRNGGLDIYGARLSLAGDVIDVDGFLIAGGPGNQMLPRVASDGTDYLVVWADDGVGTGDIRGARVSAAGAVLDPGGITVCGEPNRQARPAVASNGSQYLVAWEDWRAAPSRIYATRVSTAGVVLDGNGAVVSDNGGDASDVALASNGGDYVAVWASSSSSSQSVETALVPAAGSAGAPTVRTVSSGLGQKSSPAVVGNGTVYLVAWEDRRNGNSDIYGFRLTTTGQPAGNEAALVVKPGDQQSPALASRGSVGYLLTWDDTGGGSSAPLDVNALQVFAGGAPDGQPFTVCDAQANQYRSAVAIGPGGTTVVLWTDERGGFSDYEVYGAAFTGAPATTGGTPISTSLVRQRAPAAASLGGSSLVVWSEFRNHDTGWDVFGARVGNDGALLDASGFAIAVGEGVQTNPAVASDGTSWLVVWEDGRSRIDTDVYGARVTAAGAVLDPQGLLITQENADEVSPVVASDGSGFVVVWATSGQRVYAKSVVGAQVGPAQELSPNGETPSLAGSATGYLCAWRTGGFVPNIQLQGLDSAGAPLGSGLSLPPSAPGNLLLQPSVGGNGTGYFLAWGEETGAGVTLFGARVTASGVLVDTGGLTLCPGVGQRSAQAVASDGTDYLVTWLDEGVSSPGILGTRVFSDGGVEDEGGLTYASGALGPPAITSVGARRYLVVDTGPDATTQVERLRGRLVDFRVAPVADDDDVTTPEDTPLALTLTASSSGAGSVSFAVVAGPSHGALTGTPPSLTYTPEADFHGADAFSFTASADGLVSASATVRITVTPVNDAPVASPQTLTTRRDTPLVVTLSGFDVDGDALSYRVVSGPSHGALTGTPPSLTYTPAALYVGDDGFEFVADDGVAVSSPALVSITVQPAGGEPDAGQPDGGEPDAGQSDGGVSDDYRLKVGCGCGTPGVGLAPWALLVAVWLRRRRTS